MDFSNNALVVLTLSILGIALFATVLSLNITASLSPVAFATKTGFANINLSINETVSIRLQDSSIDFGTCNIVSPLMTFDSSLDGSTTNNSHCSQAAFFPDFMLIENDGNTVANIYVQLGMLPSHSSLYSGASSAYMEFMTRNGVSGGCTSPASWTKFMLPSFDYIACSQLDIFTSADQLEFYVRLTMPSTAMSTGSNTLSLLFTASASS